MRAPRTLPALSLPLAAAACLLGHAAGYAIVGESRQDVLAHGYLSNLPFVLAVSFTVLATAFGLRVTGRLRGRPAVWPFALLPPLAFLTQELVERLAAGVPAHAMLERSVVVGFFAQLPLALIAFFAARALLRAADAIRRVLARRRFVVLRPQPILGPAAPLTIVVEPLCYDRLGRAPPRC